MSSWRVMDLGGNVNQADAPVEDGSAVTDAELIRLAQSGDTVAFGELVDRHKDAMVNYLTRLTGSREEAEDYSQEAFLRLYERAASYRERGYFKAYLYRIATNLVRSAERRRRRWRVIHSLISTNGHHSEPRQQHRLLASEIGHHLRRAVCELPLRYRVPLVLYEVDEWPYRRIAEFLGCREGTVKSRIHRGRNMIRERLEPYVNGGFS